MAAPWYAATLAAPGTSRRWFDAAPPTVPATITLGRVTETDTARALTVVQGAAPGILIGRVTETDSVRSLSVITALVRSIGRVSEVETARGLTPVLANRIAFGRVSEADTARTLLPHTSTAITLGRVTEVDSLHPLTQGGSFSAVLGRIVEVEDLVRPMGIKLGFRAVVSESETVLPLVVVLGGVGATLGRVVETDSVRGSLTPQLVTVVPIQTIVETSIARRLGLGKPIGRLEETSLAFGLAPLLSYQATIGRVSEADITRPLGVVLDLGRVQEVDSISSLSYLRSIIKVRILVGGVEVPVEFLGIMRNGELALATVSYWHNGQEHLMEREIVSG